jgi:formylglycine-generating enzyme required for sulfatase activity
MSLKYLYSPPKTWLAVATGQELPRLPAKLAGILFPRVPMKKLFTLLLGFLLPVLAVQANNLSLSFVGFTAASPPLPNAVDLVVDAQWDNSWHDSNNWDAAWIFVKFRSRGGGLWRTATLSTSDAAHRVPAGTALNAATDGKGVFVYRAGAGAGTFRIPGLHLQWNAAADGITSFVPGYDVKVFGVEMVHVPEGGFSLNTASQSALTNEFQSVNGSLSQISSEAALPAGAIRWVNESGGGGSGNEISVGGLSYAGSAPLGANYPKGYAAMYCMKYEISQGQYTDFLNSLTRTQQNRRVDVNISADAPAGGNIYVMAAASTAANAFRNTITCPASGMGTTQPVSFSCSRPDRAGNFLIWADGAAYLDWAGLRPMSELEYEKACRGPQPAVAGEYAWGSTNVGRAATISGPEDGSETTDATANMVYNVSGNTPYVPFVGGDGGDGPLRCGIFARASTSREQAGATYYGIMEMSGNCWERCVTVAAFDFGLPTNAGLFDYTRNGDGSLTANGDHDVATWPNSTDVLGSNYRGGNWSRQREWATVADRTYGGNAIPGRTSHRSIRGVRSVSTANPPAGGPIIGIIYPDKFYGGANDGYAAAPGLITDISATRAACAACAGVSAIVLPNPVTDAAILRLSGRAALTDATLTLTDALGRVVRRQEHLRGLDLELNRTGLAPGLYFYQVSENGEAVVHPGRIIVD